MIDKTLFELLSDAGVPRLKSYAPGATEKLVCPVCNGGRTKDHCLSVTIGKDGNAAMWQCHRGNCSGFSGKVVVQERRAQSARPKPAPRYAHPFSRTMERDPDIQPEWFWQFWNERHIGTDTLKHFGVYGSKRVFNKGEEERDCLIFPYVWNGKQVNRKFRSHPNKDYRNDAGSTPTLFNVDSIVPGEPLHWVEGETDVMSMHEAGYPSTVSLRDGAPQSVGNSNDRRFEALRTHADHLALPSEHILCPDADKPGEAWLEELSRRLGRHKCRIVRWPKGRKDASDTLRMSAGVDPEEYDAVSIRACVEAAQKFPLDGVRDIDLAAIERAFTRRVPPTMSVGLPSLDGAVRFPTEGKLIVLTGIPAHGKSAFMRFVAVETIRSHKRRWLAFVAEDDFDEYVTDLTLLVNQKVYQEIEAPDMRSAATILGGGNMRVLEFDAERNPALVDTILGRARQSVLRDGTTDLLIDPWNELEHQRGDQTETDYIGRTLQRFRQFSIETECNVWIAAHPVKSLVRPNETRQAPTGYDISGSANWANKPDLGFTIWSAEKCKAEIRVWKARRHRWATRGAVAALEFDQATGRYLEPLDVAPAGPTQTRNWQGEREEEQTVF